MARYLVTRLLHAIGVLLIVATVTFVMIQSAPGGPSILSNADLSKEDADLIRHNLGLDQPIYVQYGRWLGQLLTGDLGTSLSYSQPVTELIGSRLPATLLLSGCALLLAVVVAIPLGVVAARHRAGPIDLLASFVSMFGQSIPTFWLGIMLILGLAVSWKLLPSSGMFTAGQETSLTDLAAHLVMPTLVLGLASLASVVRYTRSSMLGVLRSEYIRTARAKGLTERSILYGHALRSALVPVVTAVGVLLPRLVGGAVVTETIFAWPGMGRLAADAAIRRDYPIVMGVTLTITAVVVLSNLLVDLLYSWLDPRIDATA